MLNSLREQARSHISIEISLKILRWSRNTAMDIQQIVMLATGGEPDDGRPRTAQTHATPLIPLMRSIL